MSFEHLHSPRMSASVWFIISSWSINYTSNSHRHFHLHFIRFYVTSIFLFSLQNNIAVKIQKDSYYLRKSKYCFEKSSQ